MSSTRFSGVASVMVRSDDGVWLSRGTAFLISSRHAITAFHVLDGAHGEVVLRFPGCASDRTHDFRACEMTDLRNEHRDWAVLRCEKSPLPEVRPIGLSPSVRVNARWETRGFPVGRDADGLTIDGVVLDPHARDRELRSLQLYSAMINGENVLGLSGAPCLVRGRAVGLIRSRFSTDHEKTNAGTLYATPISELAGAVTQRLEDVRDRELIELRNRLHLTRYDRAAQLAVRVLLVSVALLFAFALCFTEVSLQLLDGNSAPEERVRVELRDCLRGGLSGRSDQRGKVRFIAFRWCPVLPITLDHGGAKGQRRLEIASSRFVVWRAISCVIRSGLPIDCL